jgi:hypothetical protein
MHSRWFRVLTVQTDLGIPTGVPDAIKQVTHQQISIAARNKRTGKLSRAEIRRLCALQ